MSEKDRWIPPEKWEVIVDNVPIVSVDLIVKYEGGVLLGLRENEPAKGEWFVPGGRVRKGEKLEAAVHRIAREELAVDVDIKSMLGTYGHFYERSEVGTSKHYVAHGYHVRTGETELKSDSQHRALSVFETRPENLHEYVEQYLAAADLTTLP